MTKARMIYSGYLAQEMHPKYDGKSKVKGFFNFSLDRVVTLLAHIPLVLQSSLVYMS